MPCYTINTVSIEIKAENHKLIFEVLKDMKLNPWYATTKEDKIQTNIGLFNLNTGKVEIRDTNFYKNKVNEFRLKYSEKIIQVAAKINKWNLKQKEEREFELNKW